MKKGVALRGNSFLIEGGRHQACQARFFMPILAAVQSRMRAKME